MADYISRQAAIEIMQNLYPGMPRVSWLRKDWEKRYEPYIRTEKAIRELPSADVRENVRGKWIDVDPYGDSGLAFKCSECEKISIRDTNYCPNCGADMRGEQNGKNG